VRNQRRTNSNSRRIAVWITNDMAKWKDETQFSWGDLVKAGIEALSKGGKTIYKTGTIGEMMIRLDWFIKESTRLRERVNQLEKKERENEN
jgi:hypothetical protein